MLDSINLLENVESSDALPGQRVKMSLETDCALIKARETAHSHCGQELYIVQIIVERSQNECPNQE
jgi:hypothetical protein